MLKLQFLAALIGLALLCKEALGNYENLPSVRIDDPCNKPQSFSIVDPAGKLVAIGSCRAPLVATSEGCVAPTAVSGSKVVAGNLPVAVVNDGFIANKTDLKELVRSLESCPQSSSFITISAGGKVIPIKVVLAEKDGRPECSRDYDYRFTAQWPIEQITDGPGPNKTRGSKTLDLVAVPDGKTSYALVPYQPRGGYDKVYGSSLAPAPARRRLLQTQLESCAITWFGQAAVGFIVAVLAGCLVFFALGPGGYIACVVIAGVLSAITVITGFFVCITQPPSCFPGDAVLTLASSNRIPMSLLQVGQRVASGPLSLPSPASSSPYPPSRHGAVRYSDVYAFGHRDPHAVAPFVHITLESNSSIDVSPRHFLPYATADGCRSFKYGKDVAVGDYLWEASSAEGGFYVPRRVASVTPELKEGLYNPLVLDGTIEVNGIVASCHSDWFLDDLVPKGLVPYLPAVYQGALAPARVLYRWVGAEGARAIAESVDVHNVGTGALSYVRMLGAVAKASVDHASASK